MSSNMPRVLVVDDNAVNVKLMEAYLSAVQCEVLTADRVRALEVGADDFLSKPVERSELLARVRSSLRLKGLIDTLEDTERVIYALARAVEAKDSYTEAHTERVAGNARKLGELCGLNHLELDELYRGGMVHDIGKIGVPDSALLKAGPLDPDEQALMRRHPLIGAAIAKSLRTGRGGILSIIRHHHEHFDGSGYPDHLAGEDIPLMARIVSVCDAFDAITSDRPYRKGGSAEKAAAILRAGAGVQWDPDLVDKFITGVLGMPATVPAVEEKVST
jgi:putative two-component system response regulator